jgi:5-methylcytosine-specific restriction endonuclease McrA
MADGRQAAMNDKRRRNEPRPCADCGRTMRVGTRCRACAQTHRNRLRAVERRRARVERKLAEAAEGSGPKWQLVAGSCTRCGVAFVAWRPSQHCSRACYSSAKRKSPAAHARRKGREAGWKLTKARRLALYQRDGWTCQICALPVDPDAMGTIQPDAPTADHVIPLAKGGKHAWENLQTAHYACNVRKGARMTARVPQNGVLSAL